MTEHHTTCKGCGGHIGNLHAGACIAFPYGGKIDQDEVDQSQWMVTLMTEPTIAALCKARDAIQAEIDELMKQPLHIRRAGYDR